MGVLSKLGIEALREAQNFVQGAHEHAGGQGALWEEAIPWKARPISYESRPEKSETIVIQVPDNQNQGK